MLIPGGILLVAFTFNAPVAVHYRGVTSVAVYFSQSAKPSPNLPQQRRSAIASLFDVGSP